jgi:dolichol-phosphate mannosyltransferase
MNIAPAVLARVLRFGVVGASGVLVNQVTLWFAHEHLFTGMSPRLALNASLAVAISLATVNNYLLNRLWTWRDRDRARSANGNLVQFGQYCVAVAVGSAMQMVLTNLFALFLRYLLANFCAIIVAGGVNFAINNRLTFRGRHASAPVSPLGAPS